MYPFKIQHILNWSCFSFAQTSPVAPHFTWSINQGPCNGPWGPHGTSLNSPAHLPLSSWVQELASTLLLWYTRRHVLALKLTPCPVCSAHKMQGPFLLSWNLDFLITLLMKPLLRTQFKILNCPLPPLNAPYPPYLSSVFLHRKTFHLLCLLPKYSYLSISSIQRQCFFGVLFPYVSSEFRTVLDMQFTLNKYLLNEWAACYTDHLLKLVEAWLVQS